MDHMPDDVEYKTSQRRIPQSQTLYFFIRDSTRVHKELLRPLSRQLLDLRSYSTIHSIIVCLFPHHHHSTISYQFHEAIEQVWTLPSENRLEVLLFSPESNYH